jgi:hypothetical protein
MLVKDTEMLSKHEHASNIQRTRQIAFDAGKNDTKGSWATRDAINHERQTGKGILTTDFMVKLRSICPTIVMDKHPGQDAPHHTQFYKLNHDKAVLSLLMPDGKKVYLFVVEDEYMPEWTIMKEKKVLGPGSDPNSPPVYVDIPWHRVKRGWREVLMMLGMKNLVTKTDVERVFGIGQRESWRNFWSGIGGKIL